MFLLFHMGVKLGISARGKNIYWGCFRIGCRGEYLDLSGVK